MMETKNERIPFVFESKEKSIVEKTVKRLNKIVTDRTFSIDFEDGIWFVFELEDEDEI